jgi:hypothetical protein
MAFKVGIQCSSRVAEAPADESEGLWNKLVALLYKRDTRDYSISTEVPKDQGLEGSSQV